MALMDREGTVLLIGRLAGDLHPVSPPPCASAAALPGNRHRFFRIRNHPPFPGGTESICRNGLNYIGMPILLEGELLATFFLSQFFYEPPDLQRFRRQAREFGLDEESYLAAVSKVPVVSRARVSDLLGFYSGFVQLLAAMATSSRQQLADRQRAAAALEFRARLEQLIAATSTRFVNLSPAEVDAAMGQALAEIGEFVQVDRSYIFQFSEDGSTMSNTHEWCAAGIEPQQHRLQHMPAAALPWFIRQIRNRQVCYCPSVAELGPEAAPEKAEWQAEDIQSLICVPMVFEEKVVGFVGFDSVRERKAWSEEVILLLRIVGECFAGALERRQADQALHESEYRFRTMFSSAPVGMAAVSPEGRFLQVNPAFCRFLGYGEDELWQLTLEKVTHPEDLEANRQPSPAGLPGSRPVAEMERRFLRHDGTIAWGQMSLVGIYDAAGRLLYRMAQVQDITDRRKAEDSLKRAAYEAEEARDKIDAILESVADGLIVTDLFDRVILMNRAAEALLGISLDRNPRRHIDSVLPEKDLRRQIVATRQGEKEVAEMAWERLDAAGRHQALQARTTRVDRAGVRLTGTITILRDITRERELDRMRDEFISTAAHELRTPLATVMGFVELLLKPEEFPLSPEERREYLTLVYQKSEVLEKIIGDLLDLSRFQAGHLITLQKSRLDFTALVRQAVAAFQAMTDRHVFRLEFPPEPIILFIDPGKIGQVLENLLSNAVKFSPAGGVIRVSGRRTDGEYQVTVADEGIGMEPEQVARIFDKFYRVDASNTAISGLGLGMSMVKSIVETHGGRIWVESRPGQGTEVHFTLPTEPPDHR